MFADEYLLTGHINNSAKKAGYSPKSAHVSGNRLLKRPDVQQYLQAQAAKLTIKTEDMQAKILNELDAMAFANIADFITIDSDGLPHADFSKATPEQMRAIASVKSKTTRRYDKDGNLSATDIESAFTMADKYRGLELLGKHHGLFKTEEQRIVVDIADRLVTARRRYAELGDDREFGDDDAGGGGTGV